jgi:hypothetical protein
MVSITARRDQSVPTEEGQPVILKKKVGYVIWTS